MAEVPSKPIESKFLKEGLREGAFSKGPKVVFPGKSENCIKPLPVFSSGLLPAFSLGSSCGSGLHSGGQHRASVETLFGAEENGRYSSVPGPHQFGNPSGPLRISSTGANLPPEKCFSVALGLAL